MTAPSGSVPEPAERRCGYCQIGTHRVDPRCDTCECYGDCPLVPAPTEPKENTVSDDGCTCGTANPFHSASCPAADVVLTRAFAAADHPVPAPTVDLDAGNAARPDWIDSLGATLRRQRDEARAELSVLRAREAQVRELAQEWDDAWEPCGESLLAVLDGTTGSGKTG